MGQYFSNEKISSNITQYKTKILNKEYVFNTDNGVFSKNKLDFGTRILLETLPLTKLYGNVLDVGTGYGIIPIVLSKNINAKFTGVDINKRALHLATMNSKDNKCNNITFIESNSYENVNEKYNFIITNPPIRAGKKIVYEILMGAENYLLNDGMLFFVIRKEQGAKTTIRDLEKKYIVTVLNKEKGFFVIKCELR